MGSPFYHASRYIPSWPAAMLHGCAGLDFGLAELKVTFEDVLSAFVGSLLCIIAWRLSRTRAGQKI
jgi:hypothetical protein